MSFQWEALQVPGIDPAVDAVATGVYRFRRKRDQGIGVRSLYEKWEEMRLDDIVRVSDHKFVIAIAICGIAIHGVTRECTRRLSVHVFLQLYITRDNAEPGDHSQRQGARTSVLHRQLDGDSSRTLDATLRDNIFADVSVPFMFVR